MSIQQQIEQELKEIADPEYAAGARRFFKENINCLGVSNPVGQQIAKKYLPQLKKMSKQEVFDICEQLFASGIHEEGVIAGIYSKSVSRKFEYDDFYLFERWIEQYVTNWAVCDGFCNHTMGNLLISFPEHIPNMYPWTKSANRWVRRAAAVSLIVPARNGMYLPEVLHIANLLLTDGDDLVQKGYGWMLKVAADKHLDEVFAFILTNKATMPRTALRYAIEKMPEGMRLEALRK